MILEFQELITLTKLHLLNSRGHVPKETVSPVKNQQPSISKLAPPAAPPVAKPMIQEVPPPPLETPPIKQEILEPKRTEIPFNETKAELVRLFPKMKVVEAIPPDTRAQAYAKQWQQPPQVILFIPHGSQQQFDFIDKVREAIVSRFCPARCLQGTWDEGISVASLKLVIATDASIKEKLGSTPLIILRDVSAAMKDPVLKKELWKQISDILSHV